MTKRKPVAVMPVFVAPVIKLWQVTCGMTVKMTRNRERDFRLSWVVAADSGAAAIKTIKERESLADMAATHIYWQAGGVPENYIGLSTDIGVVRKRARNKRG